MALHVPFRNDYVGSFLRPQKLAEARKQFFAGDLSREDLTVIEDECIRDLVAKQKAHGFHALTDGEFRRATWHLDFMWGFNGVDHTPTETGIPFNGVDAMIDDTFLTGKLSVDTHPFIEHYKFLYELSDEEHIAKQTIPAPAQFLFQLIMPQNLAGTREIYATDEELIEDLAAGYLKVINDLRDAGCRNVQFDDCTWGVCVDPNAKLILNTDDEGVERFKSLLLQANNAVLSRKPEDVVITTHICRGNFKSTWACQGGYAAVADYVLAQEQVDAFYLEFDDDRSGDFEPLAKIPAGKKVVLGLFTSKSPRLEDPEQIKARIAEATKFKPLEELCVSPQCGFASCEEGNNLTEDEQWAKLDLVRSVAEQVWDDVL